MVSFEEFERASENLLETSVRLNDRWRKVQVADGFYLEKTVFRKIVSDLSNPEAPDSGSTGSDVGRFVFQIVYNEAFEVPQLFFSAHQIDGEQLRIEELHRLIPSHMAPDDVWGSLSQMEHPILHTPSFTLHPCKSAELIARFKDGSPNWMISWLSSIGPAVGLHLSNAYAFPKHVKPETEGNTQP